jgi:hypothetical protein
VLIFEMDETVFSGVNETLRDVELQWENRKKTCNEMETKHEKKNLVFPIVFCVNLTLVEVLDLYLPVLLSSRARTVALYTSSKSLCDAINIKKQKNRKGNKQERGRK